MAEKQYVLFRLGKEEYGLDIINIQEICRHQPISKLPQMPKYVEGIINYRGSVIPVFSLSKKFGVHSDAAITDDTRIIIVMYNDRRIGILVDEASSTVKIDDENTEPTPNSIHSAFEVEKIGKYDDKLISLLNINRMFVESDVEKMQEA